MQRTGCVYLHRCTVTGKVYVGQTVTTMHKRWRSHVRRAVRGENYTSHFYNALRKYGTKCWEHVILVDNVCAEYLGKLEKFFIKHFDSYANGYNSTLGGEGTLGRKLDKDHIQKLKDVHKGNIYGKGWKPSAAQRERLSKAHKGKVLSEKARNLVRASKVGLKNYNARPTNIYTLDGKLIAKGVSLREWCRNNPTYNQSALGRTALGKAKQHKGLYAVYTVSFEDMSS